MLIKKNMGILAIVSLLFATVVIYGNPIMSAAAIKDKGGLKGTSDVPNKKAAQLLQ
jgi:hypothetical protein